MKLCMGHTSLYGHALISQQLGFKLERKLDNELCLCCDDRSWIHNEISLTSIQTHTYTRLQSPLCLTSCLEDVQQHLDQFRIKIERRDFGTERRIK